MPKRLELTGKIFNHWTVKKFEYTRKGVSYWSCLCSCGQEKTVVGRNLTSGTSKSCGCFQKEQASITNTTHGFSHNSNKPNKLEKAFYSRWQGMKQRCSNSWWEIHPTYTGVGYCKLWETFEGFRNNQPEGRSYEIGLVLSRIGDQGDYTPENCKWVTKSENAIEANSLQKHKYRLPTGETGLSVAIKNGVPCGTFYGRIKRGLSIEEACKPKIT